MRTLMIAAASRQSAIGLFAALEGFRAHLSNTDGSYRLEVELGPDDCDLVEVLGAIARHVSEREDGPARLELGGRTYSVFPT